MKKLLISVICWFVQHDYRTLRRITPEIKEVCCARCKRMWSMDTLSETLTPMDQELMDIHEFVLDPSNTDKFNKITRK